MRAGILYSLYVMTQREMTHESRFWRTDVSEVALVHEMSFVSFRLARLARLAVGCGCGWPNRVTVCNPHDVTRAVERVLHKV